jgi:hypothetical protein
MLNQVSMGKMFSDDNIFLQPLNNYVAFTSEKFAQYTLAGEQIMMIMMNPIRDNLLEWYHSDTSA